jgi:anti-sigma regulatory factor (Ser/Thr protein kinase)
MRAQAAAIQEALNNAVKHANATRVEIRVSEHAIKSHAHFLSADIVVVIFSECSKPN